MTRIRLGWESRLDQITVLVLFTVIGLGLVLLGAAMDWAGWLTVPMIVVGALFILVILVRLNGWRSLWWPRDLVITGEGIAYDAKMRGTFRIAWADLAAVGVHSDNGVNERFGLTLVFFPRSADLGQRVLSPNLLRLPRNGALKVRLPRRAGLAEAIRAAAPGNWQRLPSPWDALVAAPGVAPQVVPAPDPRPPVVVNVGKRTRWQALIGGALAVAASAAFLAIIFGQSQGGVGVKVLAGVLGIPFFLLALGLLLSVPMVARSRFFVLDGDSFTWDDPSGEPFMIGWPEITMVAVETSLSAPAPSTWAAQRRLDNIIVRTRQEEKRVPVGTQPGTVEQLGNAVQQFAPNVWAGAQTRTAGRFQLK